MPLPIVLISVFVNDLTSTVLFIIDEVALIEMPFGDPFDSGAIPLNLSLLIDADVAEIELVAVVPNGSLGLCRHKREDDAILVFLDGEIISLRRERKMSKYRLACLYNIFF